MSGKAVGAPSAGQVDIEAYDYLGLSTVVRVLRAEQAGAGGSLTYVAVGSEGTNTWAGDAYNGLDRFGRVADRRWVLGSTASGADADRLKYGYDAGSNPLFKLNTLSAAHSEVFTYDGLGRLATFDRGSIAFSGSGVATVASPTRSQDWTLDTLGNWDSLTTAAGGSTVTQTREHDRQNRLTTLAGQSLTYDSNGNQLTDESGNVLVYDAWDRNVGWYNPDTSGYVDPGFYVFDEDGNPTVSNPYDALGRRVSRRWTTTDWVMGTTQTDTAYLSAPDGRRLWEWTVWSGASVAEGFGDAGPDVAGYTYVYAATDPNRLAARDTFSRTTVGDPRFNAYNGPTFLAERAYVRGDLVGNTTSTAVITSDGTTATVGTTERYVVDPYGDGVVVMDGSFTPKSGNASDRGWNNFFQTGFTDPASGLIHFGAREYDPSQGRWLQQDPAGWPDGSNRYEAMRSAPTRWVDPSGLQSEPVVCGMPNLFHPDPEGYHWDVGRGCYVKDGQSEEERYLEWRRQYVAAGSIQQQTKFPVKQAARNWGRGIGLAVGGIFGIPLGALGIAGGLVGGAITGQEVGDIIGDILEDPHGRDGWVPGPPASAPPSGPPGPAPVIPYPPIPSPATRPSVTIRSDFVEEATVTTTPDGSTHTVIKNGRNVRITIK